MFGCSYVWLLLVNSFVPVEFQFLLVQSDG